MDEDTDGFAGAGASRHRQAAEEGATRCNFFLLVCRRARQAIAVGISVAPCDE